MSQRTEKIRRRVEDLERHVADLYAMQMDDDRFAAALQAVRDQTATEEARLRRSIADRAHQAEQNVVAWRRIAFVSLAAAIIIEIVALLAAHAWRVEIAALEPTTSEAVPSAAAPIQEAFENELIEAALLARATVIDDCVVTHYDVCVECCGKDDGITASGIRATPGVTVAVDPDVIPLGADVLVDYGDGEIHYYRADDVAGGVKGNHIDLCVSSHEEARALGRRTATVYWAAEEGV